MRNYKESDNYILYFSSKTHTNFSCAKIGI